MEKYVYILLHFCVLQRNRYDIRQQTSISVCKYNDGRVGCMEMLTKDGIYNSDRERAYEYSLPKYLQHDLDV